MSLLVTTTPAEVRATPPSGLTFVSAAACACLSTRWSSTRPQIALMPCAAALFAWGGSWEPGWLAFGDIGFLLTSRGQSRGAVEFRRDNCQGKNRPLKSYFGSRQFAS